MSASTSPGVMTIPLALTVCAPAGAATFLPICAILPCAMTTVASVITSPVPVCTVAPV